MPIWRPKNCYESVRVIGKRISTCRTVCTMRGFVTAPGSSATDYKKDAGAIASAARIRGDVRTIVTH